MGGVSCCRLPIVTPMGGSPSLCVCGGGGPDLFCPPPPPELPEARGGALGALRAQLHLALERNAWLQKRIEDLEEERDFLRCQLDKFISARGGDGEEGGGGGTMGPRGSLPAEEHGRGKAALRRGEAADGRGGEGSDNDESNSSSRGGSEDGERRRAKPRGGVSRRRVGKTRSRERQRGEWGHGGGGGA